VLVPLAAAGHDIVGLDRSRGLKRPLPAHPHIVILAKARTQEKPGALQPLGPRFREDDNEEVTRAGSSASTPAPSAAPPRSAP
jgi:hypothetical protein